MCINGTNRRTLTLRRDDLICAWDGNVTTIVDLIADTFLQRMHGDVILPNKSSMIIDQENQSRINCMPAVLFSSGIAGAKIVSVFPNNPRCFKLPNISGVIILSDVNTGIPVAVMDASFITALRTAAVDVLAARFLMRVDAESIGVVGTGEQAAFHALLFRKAFPKLQRCFISGRTKKSTDALSKSLASVGYKTTDCGDDYEWAVASSDVFVTAISGQRPIVKADWIKPGSFYCHVGGLEDEDDVALHADKIVCDDWNALKHRGSPTIARMYERGLLLDSDIYCELGDLIVGELPGRDNDEEFIYFNAIGLGFLDIAIAQNLFKSCKSKGLGTYIDFSPVDTILANKTLIEKIAG